MIKTETDRHLKFYLRLASVKELNVFKQFVQIAFGALMQGGVEDSRSDSEESLSEDNGEKKSKQRLILS